MGPIGLVEEPTLFRPEIYTLGWVGGCVWVALAIGGDGGGGVGRCEMV